MIKYDNMKNPHAVALGRLGGTKGGAARARALSPRRRQEIARQGAQARAAALSGWKRAELARNAAAARWSRLPDLLRPLLWEHAVDELRLPDKEDVVLLHVIAYGTPAQVSWLRHRFGDRKIASWLREARGWGIAGERLARWIDRSEISSWRAHDPSARFWATRGVLTGRDAPEAVRRLLKTYHPAALLWADPDHRYVIAREILTRGDEEARRWLDSIVGRDEIRDLVRGYRGAGCAEPDREKLRRELGLGTDDIPVRAGGQWP